MKNGQQSLRGLSLHTTDAEVRAHLAKNFIEANAEKIIVPALFLASLADANRFAESKTWDLAESDPNDGAVSTRNVGKAKPPSSST